MKLLLVDDDDMSRYGMRQAIEAKTTFEVVAEASDGLEAVRLAQELDVDIVLMDVRMPVMDGVQATTLIKQYKPSVYILAISGSADPSAVSGMLRAGASGYVLKGALPEEFLSPLMAAEMGTRVKPIEPVEG